MPETPSLKPDDVVDVIIKGARIDEVVKNGIHVVMPNGTTATVELSNYEGLTVKRVAPAEWPPRPGDPWKDVHGKSYWAVGSHRDQTDRLLDQGGAGWNADRLNQDYGPLILVHREGGEQA